MNKATIEVRRSPAGWYVGYLHTLEDGTTKQGRRLSPYLTTEPEAQRFLTGYNEQEWK